MVNLDQFEILVNPDNKRWTELIRLTNRDEGWMMARDDYKSWIEGVGNENFRFYCAIDKATNEVAGSVTKAIMASIDGSPRLATVGMFYVRPEFRQTGLGSLLFNRMMEGEENNNVGLNGVMAMTAKYSKRFGFSKYSDWKVAIYSAKIADIDAANLAANDTVTIVELEKLNWDEYLRFDVRICAEVRRDGYIKNLLQQSGTHNRFAVNAAGHVIGVCNIRECDSGDLALGPFYAENNEIATALLKATVKEIANITDYKSLLLVTPDTNKASIRLFNELAGGKSTFSSYWMSQFTKQPIPVCELKVYGMTDYANNFV